MTSYQKPTACYPILLLLVTFGALPLLIPSLAYAQNLDSQLIAAAWNGQTDEIEDLLDAGAKVNAKNKDGMTALIVGAWNGHTEAVKVLLSKGAKVDDKNNNGMTALMVGTWNGHTDTVKALLDADAEIEAKVGNGLTSSIMAASKGHSDIAKVLLDAGADVNEMSMVRGWKYLSMNALVGAAAQGHRAVSRQRKWDKQGPKVGRWQCPGRAPHHERIPA